MKIHFKYSKKLGYRKPGDVVEMQKSTAKALKDFGDVTDAPLTKEEDEAKEVKEAKAKEAKAKIAKKQ